VGLQERPKEAVYQIMFARYYASSLARFMAVDPSRRSVRPEFPQSWNRYTYALNNPILLIDPDGQVAGCAFAEAMTDGTAKLVVKTGCFSAEATIGIVVLATGAATLNPLQVGAGTLVLLDAGTELMSIIDYARMLEDQNADMDGDKIPNSQDPDIDGDGTPNERDPDPRDPHFGGQQGETPEPKDPSEPKDPDEPKEPDEPDEPDGAEKPGKIEMRRGNHPFTRSVR
jgi:RHS repeat-associated protein